MRVRVHGQDQHVHQDRERLELIAQVDGAEHVHAGPRRDEPGHGLRHAERLGDHLLAEGDRDHRPLLEVVLLDRLAGRVVAGDAAVDQFLFRLDDVRRHAVLGELFAREQLLVQDVFLGNHRAHGDVLDRDDQHHFFHRGRCRVHTGGQDGGHQPAPNRHDHQDHVLLFHGATPRRQMVCGPGDSAAPAATVSRRG